MYVKALFGDLDVNNNGMGLFRYTRLLAWGIILPESLSFQFQYSSDDYKLFVPINNVTMFLTVHINIKQIIIGHSNKTV